MLNVQKNFIINLLELHWEIDSGIVKGVIDEIANDKDNNLKFINPFITHGDKFDISSSYYCNDFVTNNTGNKLNIILTSNRDSDFVIKRVPSITKLPDIKKLANPRSFLLFNKGKYDKLIGFFEKNIYINLYNNTGLNKSTKPDAIKKIIETLLEIFKDIIMVTNYTYGEIVTKEVVKEIFAKELPNIDFKGLKFKNKLIDDFKIYKRKDYEGLIANLNEDIKSKEVDIDRMVNTLRQTYDVIDTYSSDIEKQKSYRQTLMVEKEKDFSIRNIEAADYIFKNLHNHFFIDEIKNINVYSDSFIIKVRTKPSKLYKYNQSPKSVIERRDHSNKKINQQLIEAYEDIDKEEGWDLWFSPLEFDIVFTDEPRNSSGLKFEVPNIKAIHAEHGNPHFRSSCYGQYFNNIEKAKEEGNLGRFLAILSEYHSGVNVGETAGNSYVERIKIARKGEPIQWDRPNHRIVLDYQEKVEKQKDQDQFEKVLKQINQDWRDL